MFFIFQSETFNYGGYIGYECGPHAAFDVVGDGNIDTVEMDQRFSCDVTTATSGTPGPSVMLPDCICKAISQLT
jgi:hypothetical protein